MNEYEQKQDNRRERIESAAAKLEAAAAAVLNVGRDHYSRDWAFITQPGYIPERARWLRKMERAFEQVEAAKRLRAKAASIGGAGISSDNPDAVDLLRDKLATLEKEQDIMKRANAIIRKHKAQPSAVPELVALGLREKTAAALLEPDFCGRRGFPSYETTNNNANMRRIRRRIAELSAKTMAADQADRTHDCGAYRVAECFEENRVRVFFDGKPRDAVRAILKANGFRWSPTAGAWQRMLNAGVVQWLTSPGGHIRAGIERAQAAP